MSVSRKMFAHNSKLQPYHGAPVNYPWRSFNSSMHPAQPGGVYSIFELPHDLHIRLRQPRVSNTAKLEPPGFWICVPRPFQNTLIFPSSTSKNSVYKGLKNGSPNQKMYQGLPNLPLCEPPTLHCCNLRTNYVISKHLCTPNFIFRKIYL